MATEHRWIWRWRKQITVEKEKWPATMEAEWPATVGWQGAGDGGIGGGGCEFCLYR